MRFQAPQLGALGVTFTAFRAMQSASLIAIIGMTANFINDIVTSERDTPDVLVGTLTVVSDKVSTPLNDNSNNSKGECRNALRFYFLYLVL